MLTVTGNPTRPQRHRQDLRTKCNPQAEREVESVETRKQDRCRCVTGPDGCYDETGYRKHDECGERNGSGDEGYGFGEGISPILRPTSWVWFRARLTDAKISAVMDRFETQFEDLDVATGYYENATTSATAVGTPQEDVDKLMNQVADEAGVELHQEMEGAKAVTAAPVKSGPTEVEEDGLGERLRALRS